MATSDFQTPAWCCDYMVSLLPAKAATILEPTPGEGNLVRAIKSSGRAVLLYDRYENIDWRVPVDAVVMNPPFTPMGVGYKILYRCMEHSSHIVALLPWLALINSQKRARDLKQFGLASVTHLPRNTFPGARVQACVFELNRDYIGDTVLHIMG